MVKAGSSSVRGKVSSPSRAARSIQTRVRTPHTSSRSARLTGNKINAQQKNSVRNVRHTKIVSTRNSRDRKITGRVDSKQKKAIERKAEKAAINYFRSQNAEVRRMQYDKVHGVDLGAIWWGKRGEIKKAAVVEVKGSGRGTPSRSVFRNQVRRDYYLPRLREAEAKGIKGAKELYMLAKNKDKRLQSMAFTSGPQGNRVYKISARGPISRNYQSVTV